ncbi:DUF2637 domain-containing protein [Actinomadura opuntiae]|uniref:DUF2637 domain-containing protein n=1 Tax=Actinomadura sp. OS1-43 TaxID=604315 RepID=UPI00255A96FB|nr:DUF2637 domain-containing protein [Actinomadura sp. OS1-43]MDL4814955.1 DUF2637 domain-containing protein [Actinomadura sp. OS1-43]
MKVSAIRASTAAVVVGIGAIAAYVSYRHALDVARAHGEPGSTGRLVPLTIDGLVYVASMVLLDAARRGAPVPFLARPALALGIGATVAVNVLHGIAHGPVGAVIAAWPAVTLVVVVELLMGMIRRGRAAEPAEDLAALEAEAIEDAEPVDDVPDEYALKAAEPDAVALPWWPLPELETVPVPVPERDGRTAEDDDQALEGEASDDDPEAGVPDVPADVLARAREEFAEHLQSGRIPGVRPIREALGCGQARAQQVRDYLAVLATK